MKMKRALILFLREEGPSTVEEMGKWVHREPRTVLNYMKYYKDIFERVDGTWRLR